MTSRLLRRAAIGGSAIALLCVGIGVGRSDLAFLAPSAAAAATPSKVAFDPAAAENEIQQRLALYALLADGDGISGKNTKQLADDLLTQDYVSESYAPDGVLKTRRVGREAVYGKPIAAGEKQTPPSPTASRHYLIGTYFDAIGPTAAKTRTTAVHFEVTRNLLGADCAKAGVDACGGRLVRTTMWVYHTTWVKTAEGWRISQNQLRSDT